MYNAIYWAFCGTGFTFAMTVLGAALESISECERGGVEE